MGQSRRRRGDETTSRLLDWTEAQKASERLAGLILALEGFRSIDPSHPLGGPDGLKDLVCLKNDVRWVAAAYFPNGTQPFSETKSKFEHDVAGVSSNNANGFAFVCNQYLSLAEREELTTAGSVENLELYHIERLANLLNQPICYGLRLEFLDIEMTKEEQLAFFAEVSQRSAENLQEVEKRLEQLIREHQNPERVYQDVRSLLQSMSFPSRSGLMGFQRTSYLPGLTEPAYVPLAELREFEQILNRITGGPFSRVYSFNPPPIRKLQIPLDEIREFETTLDRVIAKLRQAIQLKGRL